MSLLDKTRATIGLQAFRVDSVDSSLAEWAPSFTIGLYMRRHEMLVPPHPVAAARQHRREDQRKAGVPWRVLDRSGIRSRRIVEIFGRLGMLLALIRWNPDAIWALASQSIATHGLFNRMGYGYLERGFFRWQWDSDGMDSVEWVAIAERSSLEQMVEEMRTTPQQSRQA